LKHAVELAFVNAANVYGLTFVIKVLKLLIDQKISL